MTRDIRPLSLDDLPELSRFLTAGFHAPPEADFAAPEVLRWKYLEPGTAVGCSVSTDAPRSYVARDESGRIIGHLGLCRTAFEGNALAAAGGRVTTIHVIDWLGSPEHRAVGTSLLRQAHHGVATRPGSMSCSASRASRCRAGTCSMARAASAGSPCSTSSPRTRDSPGPASWSTACSMTSTSHPGTRRFWP